MAIRTSGLLTAAKNLKQCRIEHPRYIEAVETIWSYVSIAESGEAIVCVGPSRVGKSRAVAEAIDMIIPGDALEHDEAGGRLRPVLQLRLRNSSANAHVGSKGFYSQLLSRQEHPIFGVGDPLDPKRRSISLVAGRRNEPELAEAFVNTLIAERTRYLVIDEAQHLAHALGGEKAAIRMLDNIKSLAEDCQLVLVLSGTYQLKDMLEGSSHMCGRALDFEFRRYREANEEDLEEFLSVIEAIAELIPWSGGLFASNLDYLLHGSLGCVGLLMKWLRKALAIGSVQKASHLQMHHLEAALHDLGAEQAMLDEILTGEQRWLHRAKCGRSAGSTPSEEHCVQSEMDGKSQRSKRAKPFRAKQRNYKPGAR